MNINEILAGIEIFDGKYKREHIDSALSQKEEIIPHLIAILEKVKGDPESYTEDSEYQAHIYAVMLLGHWRETEAHQIIIDLVSLPDPLPYAIFGDILTENLPTILLRTCGGSLEKIKELATNKNAYDSSRGAAITAITFAVIEEIITREDALAFLGGLLTKDQADEDSFFYSQLACSIYDLYPEELMDEVHTAYKQGLIDNTLIGIKEFQEALKDGKEKCLADLRKQLSRHSQEDFHKNMQWWACFNHDEDKPSVRKQTIPNYWDMPAPKTKKKKAFWDL